MRQTTLFLGAAEVATCAGPARQPDGANPAGVLTGAGVAVRGGAVVAVGPQPDVLERFPGADRIDCAGGVLTPGLVDSHTHAVFGNWRADEYVLRSTGVSSMEIARRGAGILASVRDVRARTEEELVDLALPRLSEMLGNGTTVAEVKSGYGLTTSDELKMLRVIRRLGELQPISLYPTLLAAHEVPEEYRDRRDAYVDLVIREIIPAVAEAGLARFCDVFMEPGVFDAADAQRILHAAAEHGLIPKLHADRLEWSGGAELAAVIRAASADHLGAISESGVYALAESTTVATLLPATLFFLGRHTFAPARALLDAGATVALATDFNPGSSPTTSLPLVMTIACSQMGMSPAEALHAATAGGARALRLADGHGTIRPGAPADLVLWNVPGIDHIPYRMGARICEGVWKDGLRVW